MEHVMNGPGHWKLELVSDRGNLFSNIKWPMTSGVQFSSPVCQRQVLVLEPYLISDGVLLSWLLIGRLVERLLSFCPPFFSLFLSLTDGLIRGFNPSPCEVR
jgi:hypothetical protein